MREPAQLRRGLEAAAGITRTFIQGSSRDRTGAPSI
jgi:hypothetical protein